MIFSVFQKKCFFGYCWSTLLWYWCYYPHRSRDDLSPVCGIFQVSVVISNLAGVMLSGVILSCVIFQVSFVWCHFSAVMCHMSFVRRNLSGVICKVSFDRCHLGKHPFFWEPLPSAIIHLMRQNVDMRKLRYYTSIG